MTLDETVRQLASLKADAVLWVRRPWASGAECVVASADESPAIRRKVEEAGFAYFLEVDVAHEVIGVFGEKPPTLEEKVRLLIHYAENDAYPPWVYQR